MLFNLMSNLLVALVILLCAIVCGMNWITFGAEAGFAAGVEAGAVGAFGMGLLLTTVFNFLSTPGK